MAFASAETHLTRGPGYPVNPLEALVVSLLSSDFDVDDFMRVSPGLVRKLGSANDALVMARIVFRCALRTMLTHERDGHIWWAVTKETLAEETGLTPSQVKHSIQRLVIAGHLVAEEHQVRGVTDRTKSFRPALSTGRSRNSAKSDTSPLDRTPVTDLPISQDDKKKNPSMVSPSAAPPATQPRPSSPTPSTDITTTRIAKAFDEAWAHWPKKVDRKDAERRFREAARKVPLEDLITFIREHGTAYAAYRQKIYTPALGTWLHRERWTDELVEPELPRTTKPTATQRAERIVAMGREMDRAHAGGGANPLAIDQGFGAMP